MYVERFGSLSLVFVAKPLGLYSQAWNAALSVSLRASPSSTTYTHALATPAAMPVAFGFSVGDFIAGIQLVHDVLQALQESTGSSADFIELIRNLHGLEQAFLRVKDLQSNVSEREIFSEIYQTVSQCRDTIDGFLRKNDKFQKTLRLGGSGNTFRDALHKIQWHLYRREDVALFRSQLHAYSSRITLQLSTLQTYGSVVIEFRRQFNGYANGS